MFGQRIEHHIHICELVTELLKRKIKMIVAKPRTVFMCEEKIIRTIYERFKIQTSSGSR